MQMNRLLFLLLALLLFSCNSDKEEESLYGDILNKAPYSSITDSIRREPGNDGLYFRRAVLLNKNNLPEPALADFRKAWQLAPNETYAFGLTNALFESKPDSALLFLNQALQRFPQSLLLQLSKARALSALNRVDEAIRICDSILVVAPLEPEVYTLQSDLYERKGDLKRSALALERAYFLSPDLEKAFRLAFNYAETKNPRTIPFCDSLIGADSLKLHVEPLYVKGIYYSNTNQKEKAIKVFDETIRQDYNFLDAYIEKGRILLEQKKYEAALQTFSLANTIRPSFPDAWYWMAKSQEAMGQLEVAKLNYQKAYSLDKTFVEAKSAAERL